MFTQITEFYLSMYYLLVSEFSPGPFSAGFEQFERDFRELFNGKIFVRHFVLKFKFRLLSRWTSSGLNIQQRVLEFGEKRIY